MTPKEKAQELFDEFYDAVDQHWNQVPVAKQCALIAVDKIIQAIRYTEAKSDLGYIGFWNAVKTEIEKL